MVLGKDQKSKNDVLNKIATELRRVSFMPFGVYAIEGLELFKNFKDQYAIVHKDTSIFK